MDAGGDPAIEDELDSFSLAFPLPFRIATIIVLGAWAWGANLQYLTFLKIDIPALLRYPSRPSLTHPPHYLSTYRLASFLTVPLILSLLLFWAITRFQAALVISWEILPNFLLLLLLVSFVLPIRSLSHTGRYRFLATLRRISVGGIATASEGKFGDILLADVLTSYSKVLGDLFIALCMLFTRRHSTAKPDRDCGGILFVPLLISLPSMIRLRQCLIEYWRVRKGLETGELDAREVGWGGQHLANALKYSSAFPVIILSALQRGYDPSRMGMSETGLFRLWLLTVFINSFYSFYWDVAKDWDLDLFSALTRTALSRLSASSLGRYTLLASSSSSSLNGHSTSPNHSSYFSPAESYPYGLRRARYIHSAEIYYVVIAMDLLLRCTWSFKLSPHLDHFNDLEGGIFLMEMFEVFRRWMWIFLRVETEWVRTTKQGPAPDDILLGPPGFR